MEIEKGDRVKITLADGWWCSGTVLSASNLARPGEEDNWYIELDADSGGITGYTYWKQKSDGGTVEKATEQMQIQKDDHVKVSLPNGWWCAGKVLSANNVAHPGERDDWYIELDAKIGDSSGYVYFHHSLEGGQVEKMEEQQMSTFGDKTAKQELYQNIQFVRDEYALSLKHIIQLLAEIIAQKRDYDS